jgi:hypothetical protein
VRSSSGEGRTPGPGGGGCSVTNGSKQWPIREISAHVEGRVWSLPGLFTDSEYAKRFAKEKEDRPLTDEHCERITNGVLQAREYFQAASHTSLATAQVLLYYGMLHLAEVLIAACGKPKPPHYHGLSRIQGEYTDHLDYFGWKVKQHGVFPLLNRVVDCDINVVSNPPGMGGMVLPSTMAMIAYEYPRRDEIIGNTVQFWNIEGPFPNFTSTVSARTGSDA